MTEEEINLLNMLGECYNAFNELPLIGISVGVQEFVSSIHICQMAVMARHGYRDLKEKGVAREHEAW